MRLLCTSLQASCFELHRAPAAERTARSWRSPARGSCPLCGPPPSVSACARACRSALLEPVLTGALVYTERSSHTYRSPVPPPHRSRLLPRNLAASAHACFRGGRILTARQAGPLKWRMAFTPATLAWPNPSFEATSQRPLRALCAAPQLKR